MPSLRLPRAFDHDIAGHRVPADPITCSCIQSRGTADESEACFFRRLDCFGDDVVVRVSRSGDDLQICCSY